MPNANSNTTQFSTKSFRYPATILASGLSINTTSLIVSGATNGSVVTDVLFRNLDASNARNLDIIICATGFTELPVENNAVQISIPANSGNNGTVAIASLAALAPSLFGLDLAGNRTIGLEGSGLSGTEWSIYVINKAALTAGMYVRVLVRDF
jgi:hypothetical protein